MRQIMYTLQFGGHADGIALDAAVVLGGRQVKQPGGTVPHASQKTRRGEALLPQRWG